jgi:hypothetical protein
MIQALGDLIQQNLQIQDFVTLFLGLIVEAFPFVVLGVLVSVLVALFLKDEWVLKILPKNKVLSHMMLSGMGVLMPVCECGNVPVVRRLLLKGFSVSHAVTFLLAAPILNPITIWSTLEAFSGDHSVAVIRLVAAFVIANGIGLLISLHRKQETLLQQEFYAEVCDPHHHHSHGKLGEALEIFQTEFVTVMRMLVIGALIAAASQVFMPREIIVSIGSNVFLSVIAMIVLAFVISICANVDAFFALNFAQTFSIGSIISFLVFGPMIDIKMLSMLRTTFTVKFLVILTTLVFLSSMTVGLLVNYLL